MKRYLLAIVLFPILASCEGFIGPALLDIPIGRAEPSPFREESLEFLELGLTTKQEVRETISQEVRETISIEMSLNLTERQDSSGSWWLYRARVGGIEWLDMGRSYRIEYLLIRFDRDDVVQDYLVTDQSSVADDLTAFALHIGQTSKAEVRTILGEPFELADGRHWIYGHSPPVFSEACRSLGYFNCVSYQREPKSYLLIRFDDHGTVQEYVQDDGRNACDQFRGICLSSNTIMSFGQADADQQAKQFEVSADRCALYVYLRPEDHATSIYVDREWLIDLVSGESYYYYVLKPGHHSLVTKYPEISIYASLAIDCIGGQLFFARPVIGGINLSIIDPSTGAREIERRLIAKDSYPERPSLEFAESLEPIEVGTPRPTIPSR